MKNKQQIEIKIRIKAPRTIVGKYVDDLSLIPSFHPIVKEVEYLSGKQFREKGVKYKCIIPHGPRKGSCVEEIVEYEKNKRMVITTPKDTWGLNNFLGDVTSELTLSDINKEETLLVLKNYFTTKGVKGWLFNLFFKPKMRRQFYKTFNGLKELIEDNTRTNL